MIKKTTIISWAVIAVIVITVLIIFFASRSKNTANLPNINCEERMAGVFDNYPDNFDDLEQAVTWCNICVESNAVPTIAEAGAFCNPRTSDSGQQCSDSDECEGYCVAPSELSTAGRCGETKLTLGCFYEMADGRAIRVCKY